MGQKYGADLAVVKRIAGRAARLSLAAACFAALWLAARPPQPAQGQAPSSDVWQTYTVRDGLPSANVTAALAGRDGTLWFGTEQGASHFDGAWESLSAADGLPAGQVRALAQTEDGALWLGAGGGLARRGPDGSLAGGPAGGPAGSPAGSPAGRLAVWTSASGLPGNEVRALLPAGRDSVWAGTSQGLARVSGADSAPAATPTATPGATASPQSTTPAGSASSGNLPTTPPTATLASPSAFAPSGLSLVGPLSGIPIWSLASAAAGDELWIGTQGHGLWTWDGSQAQRVQAAAGLLDGDVYGLLVDSAGHVWAGTDHGLVVYNGQGWQRFPLAAGGVEPRVFALAEDPEGGVWAGTDQGLYYSAGQADMPVAHLTGQNGLASDYVRTLAIDRDGAIWLGTNAGITRYAGNIWKVVHSPVSAAGGWQINAVLTDHTGRTWVGSEANGLAMWDGTAWRLVTAADGLPDSRILALMEDDHGRIWAGTGTGAGYSDGKGWHFLKPADGLAGAPVWSLGQDSGGGIWFGTDRGATWRDEAGGLHAVPELQNQRINAIRLARDGALWFGTHENGLVRLSGGRWQPINLSGGPAFKSVVLNGIAEEPNGTLWVATYDSRLWRNAAGRWEQVDNGLASQSLLSLAYLHNTLWIGTRNGFVRSDSMTWQPYAGLTLPNPEVRTVAAAADGNAFWIGTGDGLVYYHPEGTLPWVRIESVNLQTPAKGQVTLRGGALQDVRLSAGDVGTKAEDLIYLTQLESVDAAPAARSDRLVSYKDVHLPPGRYVLRALVRDVAFNYSQAATVTVVVPDAATEGRIALPFGITLPAAAAGPGAAAGVLVLCGLAAAGGIGWHARWHARRQAQQAAREAGARRSEAVERRFNPYISGEPVRAADMFFGRQELVSKIANALHQNSIMIHGERRIGKTTLLIQLAERLRHADDPDWVFIPVYVDLEGTPQERFFHLLIEEIVAVLRGCLDAIPPLRFGEMQPADYTDRDFVADLRTLLEPLRAATVPRSVRVVLLMDEMDVVNTYDTILQQQLRRIFMTTLAKNLGAVVAGIQISKAWERVESPWYNLFNEVALAPFGDTEARRLLADPVQGMYEWDDAALDFVVAHAEGRPYRLQQYGLEAVDHMLNAGRSRITLEDVQAAAEAVAGSLERA